MVTIKLRFRFFVRILYKRELNSVIDTFYLPLSIYLYSFHVLTFIPENRLTNPVILWNGYISVRPGRSSGMNVNVWMRYCKLISILFRHDFYLR